MLFLPDYNFHPKKTRNARCVSCIQNMRTTYVYHIIKKQKIRMFRIVLNGPYFVFKYLEAWLNVKKITKQIIIKER